MMAKRFAKKGLLAAITLIVVIGTAYGVKTAYAADCNSCFSAGSTNYDNQ